MLTLKLITEETDRVIRGLEKKHFKNAKEAIDEVLAVDKQRREAQQQLDKNLSEAKKLAAQIGGLMKEGKKDEAEAIKAQVSEMKDTNKQLEDTMNQAQEEMTRLLCQIPNIPYDEVPEGAAAEDNHVVKSNLKECTDKDTVGKVITEINPDAIVHCAAWTNVDGAEDPANQPIVHRINAEGTQNIAEAAKAIDAKMLYISTDYVFDGQGERPWEPDDKCYAPLNVYGQSKLDGELAVSGILTKYFIVRIAWVFGLNGKNFIKTMINVGKTHPQVRVVDDQIGTPTYTRDLARLLVDMIETEKYGYYHATNAESKSGEYISWADLAEEAYHAAGMDVKVGRVSTAEYGLSVAARPFNSRLDKSKLEKAGFMPLPDWRDAVARYVAEAGLKAE